MKLSAIVLVFCGFILGLFVILLIPNFVLFPTKITRSMFSIDNAPKKTIQAQLISYTPDISWESRTATIPAMLNNKISLSQGEEIDTGTGSAVISLDAIGTISLAKNTTLDFIQLLPFNVLLSQSKGSIIYENNKNGQLGVVVANLLAQIVSGKASIVVDSKSNMITISVASGSVIIAYNDANYNSHELTINAKQAYIFNTVAKKGELKKI